MITRIVKMSFRPEAVPEFHELFFETVEKIKGAKGCKDVALFSDCEDPCTLFTVSSWESIDDLNAYRKSDLFTATWSRTKPLFAQKAEAWSLERLAQ